MCRHAVRLLLGMALAAVTSLSSAGEWSGYIAAEYRGFTQDALAPEQHEAYFSAALQPEYYHSWQQDKLSLLFIPFARVDQYDEERTHGDIRELALIKASQNYEWRLGIRKVFWGVTEFVHLVDVINQTDLVENPDGEDKLGQPMLNLALIRPWGTVDFFVLPGFRERTFPGIEGRLRSQPYVDTDQAFYESEREDQHLDGALRWSHTLGDWDVGLYHFAGTSREPRLVLDIPSGLLFPFYELIHQSGADVQTTKGNWLWKLETIRRKGQLKTFYAATGGLEFTFYGVFDTAADLGIVAEYAYDGREDGLASAFQDDAMLGLRLTLNDTQSSELLFGVIADTESNARLYNLEASRRLGGHWKLNAEARVFDAIPVDDPMYSLRNDDYLQLELAYYF